MEVNATQPRSESLVAGLPPRRTIANRLGKMLRLSRGAFAFILLLGLFHLFLSHRPLWHTDLWGHLAYGRLISANRAIPKTEPLMPLARGVRFVDSAWLSQVLGYAAFNWEGIPAIQFLYATCITACLGLLAFCTARQTQRIWSALLAVVACTALEWHQFLIVRPQLAGLVCFVSLFTYLTRKRMGKDRWIFIPLVFALWVNLHGSFVVGLVVLAAFAAGRGIDIMRRTANCSAVWRDTLFRAWLTLLVSAVLACLLNPEGAAIFGDVWQTATNPNLSDLVEWRPLTLQMRQGQALAIVAVALMAVYRLTPRRISASELLLLFGLGAAALFSSRMIVWWSPVASYFLAVHLAATWMRFARRRHPSKIAEIRPVRLAWALAAGVTLCGVATGSPLGIALLCGIRPALESLSQQTPVGATDYLNAHPPRGQTFNTYEWGDYLLWAGPKGLRVFVASHAHLVPGEVWRDYIRVITLRSGWEKILERYEVKICVLDPDLQDDLVDALRSNREWSLVYEDDRSTIFARRR